MVKCYLFFYYCTVSFLCSFAELHSRTWPISNINTFNFGRFMPAYYMSLYFSFVCFCYCLCNRGATYIKLLMN